MKSEFTFRVFFIFVSIVAASLVFMVGKNIKFTKGNRTAQIFAQEGLLKEGDRFVDAGMYEQALKIYEQGLDPKYISQEMDKTSPLFRKVRLFRLLGEYEKALICLAEFLKAGNAPGDPEIKQELEILKRYKAGGSYELLKRLIQEKKIKNCGPTLEKCDFVLGSDAASILRFYDIGKDYDAGIEFIDEVLDWLYARENSEFENIPRPQSAAECLKKGNWHDPDVRHRDPEWRAYKLLYQYLTVREGFEKDKLNGGPDCRRQKYCIGSATKALIQSDYFPW